MHHLEPGTDLQLWGPLSVATNLGHDTYFLLLLFLVITVNTIQLLEIFREASVSIKTVDSMPVFWRPWGDRPGRFPLNPALLIASRGGGYVSASSSHWYASLLLTRFGERTTAV
jgi:hypothetical protein